MKNDATKKAAGEALMLSGTAALATIEPITGAAVSVMKDIFGHVAEARATCFFNKVKKVLKSQAPNEDELIKLIEILRKSPNLQEFLFDFTQSALKTRSELIVTMLAIAYCKLVQNESENVRFYNIACQILPTLTDEDIQVFDALSNPDSNTEWINQTMETKDEILQFAVKRDFQSYLELKFQKDYAYIKEIIISLGNKNMYEGKFSVVSTYEDVEPYVFTITNNTKLYRTLLTKAKEII